MGDKKLKILKNHVSELENNIKAMSKTEGVILNTMFSCKYMKGGDHHLYDEIDAAFSPREESN